MTQNNVPFIPIVLTDLAGDKVYLNANYIVVAEFMPADADPTIPLAHTKILVDVPNATQAPLKVKEAPEEIFQAILDTPVLMAQTVLRGMQGLDLSMLG